MAKFNEDTAWTALTAPVDTDWLLVCDASTDTVKIMDIQYLLVALDGDHLDIDFTPSNYTPSTTPAEADDVDDLAAHLYGIDQKLAEIDTVAIEQSDTTFTVSSSAHYIEIDTSGGAVTATLPSAATLGEGWKYLLKVTDATADCTLATNGAETIDGSDAWQLNNANEVLELISDGTNWKVLRWELPRPLQRPEFSYVDATSFSIGTFTMRTPTMDYPKIYAKAAITTQLDTATTGWWYLYIDASAVDTGNSPEADSSYFLLSPDEPDWDSNYGVWVGDGSTTSTTSDICIFALRVSAANTIEKWFHDGGDYVQYDNAVLEHDTAALGTGWGTTTTHVAPAFVSRLKVSLWGEVVSATLGPIYITAREGSSSGTGHTVGAWRMKSNDGGYYNTTANTFDFYCNSSQQIDWNSDVADANMDVSIDTNGWYFPKGM